MDPAEKKFLAKEMNSLFISEEKEKGTRDAIAWALSTYGRKAALSSSLSFEDQLITALMVETDKSGSRIFTLDTGRQFPETYELIDRTEMTFGIRIEVFFPDFEKVQEMVRENGINLFYDSVEKRHMCCNIRKIEPLKRALKDTDVWITGIRRSQSVTRKDMQMVEYDEADDVIKLNPLLLWEEEEVKEYVMDNGIPYNRLHDKGFPSIGCQPCTRAVKPGEDVRAGRWWWEDPLHRECGLHARG